MADTDLKVNVTTTADTSGIDQVAAATKNLQDVANRTGETLAQVTARFAEGPKFVQQTTQEVQKTTAALTLTRTEAAALANEIIRGNINVRSIGSSLAGLGNPIAIIGIAMGTIVELISKASAEQDKWVDGVLRTTEEMRKLGESILDVENTLRNTALIKGLPLEAGLRLAQQEVVKLKTEQSLLNLATKEGLDEYEKYNTKINSAQGLVDNLSKSQQHQTDTVKATTDQIAINNAQGNEELTIQLKVQQVYDQKLRALRDARVPEALAKDLATETAESERQKLEAIRGQAPAQNTLNELLRQEQTIIQSIHQQQQLIEGAPFMGVDQKNVALLNSYTAEMQKLQQISAQLQAQKAGGGLDPAQLEQVNQKLQQTNFQFQSLTQKVQALQSPLRTELTSWANSFGSTSQQVGKTIESTIGASLQAVNQFLVTGKFNAQALLQQILTLGLQLLEQMAIQRIMSLINHNASIAQAAVTGPLVAAAWGPAATAVSVATEGGADVAATSAFALALSSIQGMLALQHGGVIPGHGTGDTVPAMLTPGEFVVNRQSAAAIGYGNLEEMNMMAAGGRVRPGRNFYGDWVWHTNEAGEVVPMQLPGGGGNGLSFDDLVNMPWGGGGTSTGSTSTGSTSTGSTSTGSTSTGTGVTSPTGTPFISPGVFRGPTGPQFPTLGVAMPVMPGPPGVWSGMANLALHSSIMQNWAHSQGYKSSGDWMRRSGFTLPGGRGSGAGVGGGLRPMTQNYARGGMVSGGAPQVHVYPVMDPKEIVKNMASKEGHKLIFDVIKGRRIDLGMK